MNNPRSIQISRLLKNINFKVEVFCGFDINNNDTTLGLGELLNKIKQNNGHVTYIKENFYDNIKKKLIAKFNPNFFFPDNNIYWAKKVSSFLIKKKKIEKNSTLLTFSQPISSHFVGIELAKYIKFKWIAHFSDPWLLNPYIEQKKKN